MLGRICRFDEIVFMHVYQSVTAWSVEHRGGLSHFLIMGPPETIGLNTEQEFRMSGSTSSSSALIRPLGGCGQASAFSLLSLLNVGKRLTAFPGQADGRVYFSFSIDAYINPKFYIPKEIVSKVLGNNPSGKPFMLKLISSDKTAAIMSSSAKVRAFLSRWNLVATSTLGSATFDWKEHPMEANWMEFWKLVMMGEIGPPLVEEPVRKTTGNVRFDSQLGSLLLGISPSIPGGRATSTVSLIKTKCRQNGR